jgi:rare lipoprotein A
MNFIGLIWLTSYVSSFFSSHNLLKTPDYIIRLFSSKPLVVQSLSNPPTSLFGATSAEFHLASNVPSPLPQSSQASVPLIQSFLHPFSWLSFSEGVTLPLTRLTTLANIAPWTNLSFRESNSKEASGQITRLVASLSRWSQKIGRAMPLVPTIAITPVNTPNPDNSGSQTVHACLPSSKSFHSHESFQVRVQGQVVAALPSQAQAHTFAQRLKQALQHPEFNPASLKPAIAGNDYLLKAGNDVLFTIDSQLERSLRRTGDLIAMDWTNNLRTALDAPALSLTESQIQVHSLVETGQTLSGTASWYGPYFHGRLTANGEIFDQNELTAAHPSLPFDTYLKVTNLKNGNTVVVRINDRGPYVGERSLDLSRTAARCLGSEEVGVVPYEALVMEPGTLPAIPQPAPITNEAIARQP